METLADAARRLLQELDARAARNMGSGRPQAPDKFDAGRVVRKKHDCFPIVSDAPARNQCGFVTDGLTVPAGSAHWSIEMRLGPGAHAGAAYPRVPQGRPSFQAAANCNRRGHAEISKRSFGSVGLLSMRGLAVRDHEPPLVCEISRHPAPASDVPGSDARMYVPIRR